MPVDHALKSSWEDESSELPVAIGDVLDGKYKIVRVLGKGGMGVVMAAVHVELGHRIALKFLLRDGARNNETLARFALEAKAAALMRSEHATRILDIGRLASGEPYMVLEMLEGSDLGAIVTRRGPLPVTDAVKYVLEACEAIAEAHALGIVHRDLKPDNLFLAKRPDGTQIVKVLDFGISKFSSFTHENLGAVPALTTTSAIIGSPMYMSPEQLKSTRDVDHRTDIWSIGVALYELISGQPPFPWRNMAELSAAILKDVPEPLSSRHESVPPELDQVILRCLEKNPADRFDNIAELAWALAPFGGPQGTVSAEKASELLARAPLLQILQKLPPKRPDNNLVERQGLDTQTDPNHARSKKIVALALNATHPADQTATTEDIPHWTYALTSPVLRGLPIAGIFLALLLAVVSIGYLRRRLDTQTNITEAHRGVAAAALKNPTTPVFPGKTNRPKVNAPPTNSTMPSAAPSAKVLPPRTSNEKPRGVVKPIVPKQTRRNPFADRE